jgi:RNA polymerase sigma factor (sigma-70 family)
MTRYSLAQVRAASAGDRAAIEALLVASQHDIRRYARRTCRTSSDVEDAVQETLFVLFRHLNGLRRIESLSAWLFTVVRRQCLRLAGTVMGTSDDIDSLDQQGRLASLPDEELRIDLANAIQSLPQHYRDVILLRDIEELTINEIAIRLGATREGVKARLHRARSMLREYLVH